MCVWIAGHATSAQLVIQQTQIAQASCRIHIAIDLYDLAECLKYSDVQLCREGIRELNVLDGSTCKIKATSSLFSICTY